MGSGWMASVGVTSQEFDVMRAWSGWAHIKHPTQQGFQQLSKSKQNEDEEADLDVEHKASASTSTVPRPKGLTVADMNEIGKMIKRIFDHGRVEYLRGQGLQASQRRYCDPVLSPECYMIIAKRPNA